MPLYSNSQQPHSLPHFHDDHDHDYDYDYDKFP
jgi:hypothetical protein